MLHARWAATLTDWNDTESGGKEQLARMINDGNLNMREFNYELKQLCQRNRDGSYATQADRERILELIANQLQEMGFKHMHATSLKAKHVAALVARWHGSRLRPEPSKTAWRSCAGSPRRTARPRSSRPPMTPTAFPDRVYVTNVSKAIELDRERLARIDDPYTPMSLRAATGIRLATQGVDHDPPGVG